MTLAGCMSSYIVPMVCPLDSAVKPLEHLEHNSFRAATFFLPPKVTKSKGVKLFLKTRRENHTLQA